MKISKLSPSSIFASKATDSKVTLFFNKITGTVCYKQKGGTIIEIGENTSLIQSIVSRISTLENSEFQYKEVTILEDDFLTIGSVPVELLPELPDNQYYEWKFVKEPINPSQSSVSTVYYPTDTKNTDFLVVAPSGTYYGDIISYGDILGAKVLQGSSDSITSTTGTISDGADDYHNLKTIPTGTGSDLVVASWNGVDGIVSTTSEGARFKIWYKIRTVGSNL